MMKYAFAALVASFAVAPMGHAAKPLERCHYMILKNVQQDPVLVCGSLISESNSKTDRNPRHKCHHPKNV